MATLRLYHVLWPCFTKSLFSTRSRSCQFLRLQYLTSHNKLILNRHKVITHSITPLHQLRFQKTPFILLPIYQASRLRLTILPFSLMAFPFPITILQVDLLSFISLILSLDFFNPVSQGPSLFNLFALLEVTV